MRIEMVAAVAGGVDLVREFIEPLSIIYGRENSDRAAYGSKSRIEDVHLAILLLRQMRTERAHGRGVLRIVNQHLERMSKRYHVPAEEWRVRRMTKQ